MTLGFVTLSLILRLAGQAGAASGLCVMGK